MATCKTCQPVKQEVDPNKPVNPNTGANYPDWYPTTLQGITYNTGASTDVVPSQVTTDNINPITGEYFTAAEVAAYKRPVDMEGYLADKAATKASGASGKSSFSLSTPPTTPAPDYEMSPEEAAFNEMYGNKLTDWIENEGYGIPEETQQQMIAGQFETLKAQEEENIRVMRNNMERRGITNSGFVYANEQKIRANTTTTLANSIRDIQIQSLLMKVASFERAMGQAAQYMGYLSQQSQLEYAPKFATWQNEQQAKLMKWQGELDLYKTKLQICAQTKNTAMQIQAQQELARLQFSQQKQLAKMQIEANNKIAGAQGAGQIFGTMLMLPFMLK